MLKFIRSIPLIFNIFEFIEERVLRKFCIMNNFYQNIVYIMKLFDIMKLIYNFYIHKIMKSIIKVPFLYKVFK